MTKFGQNQARTPCTAVRTPYMTACMVIPLPKYRMHTVYTYTCMVLANPTYTPYISMYGFGQLYL